jgi:hypothetical protein
MNPLREHNRYLTEHSLDSFTGDRDQEILPWLVLFLGIAFSGYHHFYILSFVAVFLIVIVRIGAVTIKNTPIRNIVEHVLHSVNIMITAWEKGKFNRDTIHSGNNLPAPPDINCLPPF